MTLGDIDESQRTPEPFPALAWKRGVASPKVASAVEYDLDCISLANSCGGTAELEVIFVGYGRRGESDAADEYPAGLSWLERKRLLK